MDALEKAIKHFGTGVELADRLGVSTSAITNWKARGAVPPRMAKRIELVTDGAVKRKDLAPEVFE